MTRIEHEALHDPALIAVLTAISSGGHRAFLVGGVVRNALLGLPITDVDIATDARPEQVLELAENAGLKSVPTGIEHGTVTIVSGGTGFEITTFRRDVETDGRRATVAFSDRIEEDAQRRDFTMNALYATPDGEVIDPIGGIDDLRTRYLRFVGQPAARIREDYLRILRLYRFYAWYGQDIDPAALQACADLAEGLDSISNERIGAEMRKLLAAPDPSDALALMQQAKVLHRVLPGADAAQMRQLVRAEHGRTASWPRRLALLGGDDPATALRLSRDETKVQKQISEALAKDWSLNEASYRLGERLATNYALIRAARGLVLPDDWPDQIKRAAQAKLPITAADLMPDLEGPALGEGMRRAETEWIASAFTLPAQDLIRIAKETEQTT